MHCFKISSYNAKERIKRQTTAIRNTSSTKANSRARQYKSCKIRGLRRFPVCAFGFTKSTHLLRRLFCSGLISIIWNSMKRYVLCYVPYVATISTNAPVWHFLKTCISASTLELQRNTCENLEIPWCEFSK